MLGETLLLLGGGLGGLGFGVPGGVTDALEGALDGADGPFGSGGSADDDAADDGPPPDEDPTTDDDGGDGDGTSTGFGVVGIAVDPTKPIASNPNVADDAPIMNNPVSDPDSPIENNPRPNFSFPANFLGTSVFGTSVSSGDDLADPDDAIFSITIDFPVSVTSAPAFPNDIDPGETVTGVIGSDVDVDFFEIELDAGDTIIIDAIAPEGSILDSLLAVIDSSGETLVENDDFNILESLDAKILFQAPTSGDFLIAVGGFFSSTGAYEVTVTNFFDAVTPVQQIALLYEGAFGRNADLAGLNFWLDGFDAGLSVTDIAAEFIASTEFQLLFGDVDTLTDEAFIDIVFQNVLGRPPDAEGLQFYLDALADPAVDEADVLAAVSISPENAFNEQEVFLLELDGSGNVPFDNDFFLFGDFFTFV